MATSPETGPAGTRIHNEDARLIFCNEHPRGARRREMKPESTLWDYDDDAEQTVGKSTELTINPPPQSATESGQNQQLLEVGQATVNFVIMKNQLSICQRELQCKKRNVYILVHYSPAHATAPTYANHVPLHCYNAVNIVLSLRRTPFPIIPRPNQPLLFFSSPIYTFHPLPRSLITHSCTPTTSPRQSLKTL